MFSNIPVAIIVVACFVIALLLSKILIKTAKFIIKLGIFVVVFYLLLQFFAVI